ncbi:MAG: amidase domain-containing protein [Oscillospiraceae bacterium]|jgi:hypothetical protein|nr:amidase domain-containing protein [Oscillospiraceae bacterium]
MRKKQLVSGFIVITMLVVFAVSYYSVNAAEQLEKSTFDGLSEIQLTPYFSLDENSVELYVKSTMCLDEENDLFDGIKQEKTTDDINFSLIDQINLSEQTRDYLEAKQTYDTSYMIGLGYTKTYLNGGYTLKDWAVVNGNLVCDIHVHVDFQYSDYDQPSEEGELVQVVLSNPQAPTIIDWYEHDNSFDYQVRDFALDLSNPDNWLSAQDQNEILGKQALVMANMNAAVSQAQNNRTPTESANVQPSTQSEVSVQSTQALTWYQKMVNYAEANYNSANPSPGSSQAPFNDSFTSYGCTNFISHCLLAGGFDEKSGTHLGENGWFFNSASSRSSSWAGVEPFYRFLTYGYSTGPTALNSVSNSINPCRTTPVPTNF